VRAAWELSSARGVDQLLCGVSLREVAAGAGLTPSAVSYHFPTMRDLALGMAGLLVDSHGPQSAESVEGSFVEVEARSMADTVREAAAANWAVITTPEEIEFERRFSRCHSATGAGADGLEVARHMERFHRSWEGQMAAIYEQAATAADLRLVEPFTFVDLAQILEAMFDGLQRQWMCDPRSIRDGLASDAAVAIASVMLVPAGNPVALGEVSAGLPRGDLQPGSEELDPEVAAAVIVAGLFADGVDGVTLTQVGDALGWSPEDVHARLGSVRRVAALSFARHLPAVDAAAGRRQDLDAAVALSDALFELARCVLADRWCALALHVERVESRAGMSAEPEGEGIGDLVPLARIFEALLGELDGASLAVGDAAEMMVDTVLTCGATRSGVALSSVVEAALRIGAPECLTSPSVGG
jgi:AcrR family transcriptional regulator